MVATAIDLPLDRIAEICATYDVAELSVFGSVLTDRFGPDSDIDFLVEFRHSETTDLFAYVHLQGALEELLGRNVDVVPKRGLKPLIRDGVLARAWVVYSDDPKRILESEQNRERSPMPRDERLYLQDMLDACHDLEDFLQGMTLDRLVQDRLRSAAVLQKFIVLGEGAARLSEETKRRHPSIPWQKIVGLRNVAAHGYFAIDWEIIWTTGIARIPELERELVAMMREA